MTSAKQRKQEAGLKQMMDAAVRLGLYDDELDAVERLFAEMDETDTVSSHERHDRRSLALHVEAVRVLQEQPELAQPVLEVLDRWEAVADPHSKTLRDEWRRIVEGKLWALAIEPSERGNQLRQASPLGFVLDPLEREGISRGFQQTR